MVEAQDLVGLEIGNYSVKIAELGGKAHKIRLKTLDKENLHLTTDQAYKKLQVKNKVSYNLSPHETADQLRKNCLRMLSADKEQAIAAAIKRLYERNKVAGDKVAITLAAPLTAVKRMQLPKVAPDLLKEAVQWEAQQYFPFDLAEFQLDFQVLPESRHSPYYQILLVAAPKAAIEQSVRLVRRVGLDPVILDVPALALENLYAVNYYLESADQVCLVDIGATYTLMNVLRKGSTVLTHTLPLGGDHYTQVIQNKLGVDYSQAENIKQAQETLPQDLQYLLTGLSAKLAQELKQFLESSQSALGGRGIKKIFLSGGGASMNGLPEYLQGSLGRPIAVLNPLNAVRFNRSHFPLAATALGLAGMAVVIGLGLRRCL